MDLHQFFEPVDVSTFSEGQAFSEESFANSISIHQKGPAPTIGQGDLCLIGIKTSPEDQGPDWVRKFLYELKLTDNNAKLIDSGNYFLDKNDDLKVKEFIFALSEILDVGACPILIGGSQEITYLNYLAYESLDQMVNLVMVDSRIDFANQEETRLKPDTFLQNILLKDPSYLFNLSMLGLQHYFVGNQLTETFHDMYFDLYRLGQIRENFRDIEPVIRHGDFLSFDIGSIRQGDAPGNNHPSPNGFYGEEACQLAKFAGLSEKISSIGFHEFNPAFDREGQTAQLMAQMVWHFVTGYANRQEEHPQTNEEAFYKYITTLKNQDYQIIFFKSKTTDRWWMQVPLEIEDPHYDPQAVLPCSYEDYLAATRDEIPERWWQALQKLS